MLRNLKLVYLVIITPKDLLTSFSFVTFRKNFDVHAQRVKSRTNFPLFQKYFHAQKHAKEISKNKIIYVTARLYPHLNCSSALLVKVSVNDFIVSYMKI